MGRSRRRSRLLTEELRIPLLLLPGAPRLPLHELPPGEAREHGLDLFEVLEPVQPLSPLLQLTRSLRPAEHQHREERDLLFAQAERLVEQMPELDRPAAGPARKTRPAAAAELVERAPDRRLVVVDDGVPVGRLVAREPERVQRERVLVGRRPLLFDQTAQDAQLDGIGIHGRQIIGSASASARAPTMARPYRRAALSRPARRCRAPPRCRSLRVAGTP